MAWSKALNPVVIIKDVKRKIASLQRQWRDTRSEDERLRNENEQLRHRQGQLERERDRLRTVLGNNILYITVGFVWLSFADDGTAEEEVTIRQGHGECRYQLAALVCFVIFADHVLRRIEGSGETTWFWVSSGRWELIIVFGILSVVLQLLFWSEVVGWRNRRIHGE